MLVMFGTSAAFHRLRWSAPAWRRMRRADHSAIFVGIAGTSTAVAGLALPGWAQVLCSRWSGPARPPGIALRQVWLDAPQWVVAIPYVVVGWCPLVVAPQLVRGLGWAGFALMLAAGAVYTAGALVYARKRPDPWPAGLRLPRGVPRLHPGGGGAVRLPGRLRAAPLLISLSRALSGRLLSDHSSSWDHPPGPPRQLRSSIVARSPVPWTWRRWRG